MPPSGTSNFILRYHGCFGISLESLLTLPGFFIAVFLNPMKDPNHTLGIDSMQYMKRKMSIVGIGTAADDCSNQFAKFMISSIMKIRLG